MKLAVPVALTLALVSASSFFESPNGLAVAAQLQKAKFEILDKSNSVRANVFDSWSAEEVKAWLEYHRLQTKGDAVQLLETAKQNKDLLAKDVESYLETANAKGQEYASKGKEFYEASAEKLKQAANQVHKQAWTLWSDSRLTDFLEARDITVPAKASRDKLIELAETAKSKSARISADANKTVKKYWFNAWSREDLTAALEQLGQNVEGTRQELVDRIYAAYLESAKTFEQQKKAGTAKSKESLENFRKWREATFEKWNPEDLKEYLAEFGTQVQDSTENLVEKAHEQYRYFVYGETKPKTLVEHGKAVFDYASEYFKQLVGIQSKWDV